MKHFNVPVRQDEAVVAYHLNLAGDEPAAFQRAACADAGGTNEPKRGSATIRSRQGAQLVDNLFLRGSEHVARREDLALLGRNLLQLASVTNLELARHADTILLPL